MQYLSLDQACRELLIESGIMTEHKLYRAIQLGISCIRSLNLDVTGFPKTVLIEKNDNETIDLPDDYIDYIRIGFLDSKGMIRELGANSRLGLPLATDDCGNPDYSLENISTNVNPGMGNITASEWYASHFRNGEPTGRFFGLGGGNNVNGYYTIDRERNQVLLSECPAGHIYLEYLSSPIPKDGSFQIHPYVIETVKQYINWKMIEPNAERQYILEKKKTAARFANFTMTEMLAALRLSNKSVPRF